MELREYVRVVRRRWMLIVVVTALVSIGASAYVMTAHKKYASSSTLFVSTAPAGSSDSSAAAYQGGLYSQARVQSYVDMVNGSGLAQQVVDSLGLNMTVDQLSSEIRATNKPNTVLITITVTDRDPNLALRINQAVVRQLEKTITEIETPPGQKLPLLKVTVVDPARFSATPVSPKVGTDIGLGIVVGLLLGLGIAIGREALDNTVKDLREVPGFDDVPVVAALPLDSGVGAQPLITGLDRQSPRAEAFRVLRTNLQFLSVDSRSKVYVVSSSVPGEGKSTTVTNMAIALAQAGQRVLLVDADLRRPRVASLLGLVSNVGLSTALVGELQLADCIQVHADSGLQVMAAGKVPPNPAELLQSQAMKDLLAQLREQFDVILVDAPPLLPVTDAALLGSEADGVLLMVRHSKTTKDQLQGSVHRLESVNANLAGVIFNMIPKRAGGGNSSYSYGYGYAAEPVPNKRGRRRRSVKQAEAEEFRTRALKVTRPQARRVETGHSAEEIAERDRQAEALAARERETEFYVQQARAEVSDGLGFGRQYARRDDGPSGDRRGRPTR